MLVRYISAQGYSPMTRENLDIIDPLAKGHVGTDYVGHVTLFFPIHETSSDIEGESCGGEIEFIHKPYSYSLESCYVFMEDAIEIDSRLTNH